MARTSVRKRIDDLISVENHVAKLAHVFKDSGVDISEKAGRVTFAVSDSKKFNHSLDTLLGSPVFPGTSEQQGTTLTGRILVHAGQDGEVNFIEASGQKEFKDIMQNLLKVLVALFGQYHRCSSEAESSNRRSPPPDTSMAVLVTDE